MSELSDLIQQVEALQCELQQPAMDLTLTHARDCNYLTSPPLTGDEASMCSCGAIERAEQLLRDLETKPSYLPLKPGAITDALNAARVLLRRLGKEKKNA